MDDRDPHLDSELLSCRADQREPTTDLYQKIDEKQLFVRMLRAKTGTGR
jgi:hypothetical protein